MLTKILGFALSNALQVAASLVMRWWKARRLEALKSQKDTAEKKLVSLQEGKASEKRLAGAAETVAKKADKLTRVGDQLEALIKAAEDRARDKEDSDA